MKNYLEQILTTALKNQFPGLEEPPDIKIEKPREASHGDAATNIAMQLAKPLRKNPRQIAKEIVDNLDYDSDKIESVDIAGPGFINFKFSDNYLHNALLKIIKSGKRHGKTGINQGKRILVEFVSANPTGPLTVGHGRNAVLGDTIARLLEHTGAEVDREYYFNNAGKQMRVLGESVKLRYLQLLGRDIEFPEGYYEGEYIIDIATNLHKQYGSELADDESNGIFKKTAESAIFSDIQQTLMNLNISMDSFFNEHELYDDGSIDEVIEHLKEKNLAYESEGATWFRTTEFGKEKDTVLVKSTGEPTYRLPDIAYHMNKLDRGYDLCIDLFGADHIDTFPDVLNGVKALGYDEKKIDVLIYQFVTIVKEGKPYKMSTRKANFVTLDDLMEEVGADVTRFFFLMRSPSTHLEFDIAQAKESGEKNPVFYLQYAHARIKSILRKVKEIGIETDEPDLTLLNHDSEITLIKDLLLFPEAIESAAVSREPHRVINYLENLASNFTTFYHDCRIIGVENKLTVSRSILAEAVAQTLANGLGVLGIDAPDRM
ncbi:MAG TPA: arginine--tRNA ligase [Balneolaceae bacterium]|nr:arginine--tRNA ligase [Balneolaceae bacterium]